MWACFRVQDFKLNKHKSNILQFLSLHAIAMATVVELEIEMGMARTPKRAVSWGTTAQFWLRLYCGLLGSFRH